MNKILLAPLAFCLAGICSAQGESQAVDSRPVFDISGYATVSTDFNSPSVTYYDGSNKPAQITTSQAFDKNKSAKDSSLTRIACGEAEIAFSAKGQLQNGWRYGAKLAMDAMKNDTGIDKMYLIFERDNFGTIHAGNVKGPEATLLCSGQQLIGGTTGVDGVLTSDIDVATGVIMPLYVVGYTGKSSKIVWYSPRLGGFQAAFAITPDTKHVGHDAKDRSSGDSSNGNDAGIFSKGSSDKQRPSGRNNIALALNHSHDFENNWKTKFTVAYVTEDTKSVNTNCYVGEVTSDSKSASRELKLKNASSWHATAMVSYKNFSIACGYLNSGKSRLPKVSEYTDSVTKGVVLPGGFMSAKDGNSGQAWNVGARYEYKDWIFSGVYHNTSRKVTAGQKTRGHMLTFAVDYLVCPGLKLFAEVDYINTKSCDYACALYNLVHNEKNAIKKQHAEVLAIGAKVSF